MARKHKYFARVYRRAKYVGHVTNNNAFIYKAGGKRVKYEAKTVRGILKCLWANGYQTVRVYNS